MVCTQQLLTNNINIYRDYIDSLSPGLSPQICQALLFINIALFTYSVRLECQYLYC